MMVALVPLASAVDFPPLLLSNSCVLTPSFFLSISSPHFRRWRGPSSSLVFACPSSSSAGSARARRPRLLLALLSKLHRHGQITPQSSTEGHLARPAPFRSTRPICW